MSVNLASVDLRLLVLFDALVAERSVSRAALKAGISQPAASNALNRLRHLLGDRLFVRSADGMQPTPYAMRLSGPVGDALRRLQAALEPESFDPAVSAQAFRLAVSDHASIVFLPKLLMHLKRVAPHVRLDVYPKANAEIEAMLDKAEIDLAIGVVPALPTRFERIVLFEDCYVVLMRQGHSLAGQEITLNLFKAAQHVAIRPAHSIASGIDMLLHRLGTERRVDLSVTQFLAAPGIIRQTDLVATMLRRITEAIDRSGLVVRSLPFTEQKINICAVWTRLGGEGQAHRWLRRQLELVGGGMSAA